MKEIVSTITGKSQVAIPAEARRHLGVTSGDKVTFVLADDGNVELRPARFSVAALRGIVPPLPGNPTPDFEDQIDEAFSEMADRIVRQLDG